MSTPHRGRAMTVKRRNAGSGHSYYVDDEHYPGVTTILGDTVPKRGLIDWASRTTAEYAVNFWDDLAELPVSDRLALLLAAKNKDRDGAGRRGTQVHKLARKLIAGEAVDKPDELAGHIDSYLDFLDVVDPEPIATELVVANRTHRYCGTADLVAKLPAMEGPDYEFSPATWLLDVKTARSGIFWDMALQLCGYEHAEVYRHPDDPALECPVSWLGIEHCGAIHVTADGWELRPLDTGPDVWEYFLHLRWLYDRQKPPWVGDAIRPAQLQQLDHLEPDHPF